MKVRIFGLMILANSCFAAPPIPWSTTPHTTQKSSNFEDTRTVARSTMTALSTEVSDACSAAEGYLSFTSTYGRCEDDGSGLIVCKYERQMQCDKSSGHYNDTEFRDWSDGSSVKRIAYNRPAAMRNALGEIEKQFSALKALCPQTEAEWYSSEGVQGETSGRNDDGTYIAIYRVSGRCTYKKSGR